MGRGRFLPATGSLAACVRFLPARCLVPHPPAPGSGSAARRRRGGDVPAGGWGGEGAILGRVGWGGGEETGEESERRVGAKGGMGWGGRDGDMRRQLPPFHFPPLPDAAGHPAARAAFRATPRRSRPVLPIASRSGVAASRVFAAAAETPAPSLRSVTSASTVALGAADGHRGVTHPRDLSRDLCPRD